MEKGERAQKSEDGERLRAIGRRGYKGTSFEDARVVHVESVVVRKGHSAETDGSCVVEFKARTECAGAIFGYTADEVEA